MSKRLPFILLILMFGLILELAVMVVASLIPFIADNTGALSLDLIKEEAINVLLHPIATMQNLITTNNPIFYIGTIALIIYILVIILKNPEKKSEWEPETKNTTHGGARYARYNEIFVPNHINAVSEKQLLTNFKKSLQKDDD